MVMTLKGPQTHRPSVTVASEIRWAKSLTLQALYETIWDEHTDEG